MPKNDDKRNDYPGESQTEAIAFDAVCNLTALLRAEARCHRGVGYKSSVTRYHMHRLTNCDKLRREWQDGKYHTEYGTEFAITHPKYRIVTSTKYKDRIPQASFVVNYFYKKVSPNLIENNFACRKDYGVDKARKTFEDILRNAKQDDCCLCVDFKGYFASISHDKLMCEMFEYITEPWARFYYRDVVDCNGNEIGIGLGSEINQLSATSFPNRIDHQLDDGKYIRYMDDFRYVGTKERCLSVLSIVREGADVLGLNLSPKKTFIQPVKQPVQFLGYTFLRHPTGRVTKKRLPSKMYDEKRRLKKMFQKGISEETLDIHLKSAREAIKKGTRSDLHKFDKYVKKLKEIYYENH